MNNNLHPVMDPAMQHMLAAHKVVDAHRPLDMADFAARVCGIKPQITKAMINAEDTKGFYQYDYTGSAGLQLDCYLEYEAGHDGGSGPNREESWPESITLVYALHKGEDIAAVLSVDVVVTIEEEALLQMEIDRYNNEFDRAADWSEA